MNKPTDYNIKKGMQKASEKAIAKVVSDKKALQDIFKDLDENVIKYDPYSYDVKGVNQTIRKHFEACKSKSDADKEELINYAQHKETCNTNSIPKGECTCGLNELLSKHNEK